MSDTSQFVRMVMSDQFKNNNADDQYSNYTRSVMKYGETLNEKLRSLDIQSNLNYRTSDAALASVQGNNADKDCRDDDDMDTVSDVDIIKNAARNDMRSRIHLYNPSIYNNHLSRNKRTLLSRNSYLNGLYMTRTCLLCGRAYNTLSSMGRYECPFFSDTIYNQGGSHTNSIHEEGIFKLTSPYVKGTKDEFCNPFSANSMVGSLAAVHLVPNIFISGRGGTNNNRINITPGDILATYTSYKDLFDNPVLTFHGEKNLFAKKTARGTVLQYRLSKNETWSINIVELYFDSFVNFLDVIDFTRTPLSSDSVENRRIGTNECYYDDDDDDDEGEGGDDSNYIVSGDENSNPRRWNNLSFNERSQRSTLSKATADYGYYHVNMEKSLDTHFNDNIRISHNKKQIDNNSMVGNRKSVADFVSNLMKNIEQHGPILSSSITPRPSREIMTSDSYLFVPFSVIPKLQCLTS